MTQDVIAVAACDTQSRDEIAEALQSSGCRVVVLLKEESTLADLVQQSAKLLILEIAGDLSTSLRWLSYLSQPASELLVIAVVRSEDDLNSLTGFPVYDFVKRPFQQASFSRCVERALEHCNLVTENSRLKSVLTNAVNGSEQEFRIPQLPDVAINLKNIERELLSRALDKFGGNQTRTARYLNISRRTLIYRMGKYGLRRASNPALMTEIII